MLFRNLALVIMMSLSGLTAFAEEDSQAEKTKEEVAIPLADEIFVKMETTKGSIILRLDGKSAPNTVKNFIEYVNDGFYDNLIFHRVIRDFMIQGGGYDESLKIKETKSPIEIESKNGLVNDKGSIAMARTSAPNSATSQFFINTVDNEFLNYPGQDGYGYTVFGKVISGMDVVESIEKVATTRIKGHSDVPLEPIVIMTISIVEKPSPK